ncbi:hypothetical protein BTHE68_22830 [Burkholderia sp. THE68]|uniref:hypothetical protein n=1 Tax=Burkholderia sp. THE68 TaxID=758782 RepID=UPI0013167AB6|nr:hypothetical protein [Burkholderia sp. THE68]BBU28549.1 hypothetical protein BTHE68_22830 [Burkholderia sp. THE68]
MIHSCRRFSLHELVNVTSERKNDLQFLRTDAREIPVTVALTEALRKVEAAASNLLHDEFPRFGRAIHDSSIDGAIYERTA